jgi:hypothetical protein
MAPLCANKQSDAITATKNYRRKTTLNVRRQDTVISATHEATTPFGVLGGPKVIDSKTLPSKVS